MPPDVLTPALIAAAPAPQAPILELRGRRAVLALSSELEPGSAVAVYVEEIRRDPRTQAPLAGRRYAGDARVTWIGPGLIEIELLSTAGITAGAHLTLGAPRGLPPVAPAPPRPPEPVPRVAQPEAVPDPPRPPRRRLLGDAHGAAVVEPGQALVLRGGHASDGYGTGLSHGAVRWRLRPAAGPTRVDLELEGLSGQRWLTPEIDIGETDGESDEGAAREPAVAYWLWAGSDGPMLHLSPTAALGVGVGQEGLELGWELGLRSGHPDGTHVAIAWRRVGALGSLTTLSGQLCLGSPAGPSARAGSPGVRAGLRIRRGDLPRHADPGGTLQQDRADGALTLGVPLGPRTDLALAGGLGGYDLLWADAGPVADITLERRW